MTLKTRVYEILEVDRSHSASGRTVQRALLTLIIVNVVANVVETVPEVQEIAPAFFHWLEVVSVSVFSAEYVLRLWACTRDLRYTRAFAGRVRYLVTPLALADLAAVLPFYLPYVGLDLRVFRAVRLLRLLRIAKLARYSRALRLLGQVISAKRDELIVTLTLMAVILVLASSLLYYAESAAQPERFSSIPASLWWGVTTLTTVGYGDVVPVTGVGKLLAGVISILSIGFFALPTGILGSGFQEAVRHPRHAVRQCPHCGGEIGLPSETE